MKYFKDASGSVYAYESDGSQDAFIPPKLTPVSQAEADTLRAPPPPTSEQQKAACVAAIQAELDRQAQARGYDNIDSCAKYAALPPGSPFQAESAALVLWCANTWQEAYAKQAQIAAGTATMPTPAEAVAAMPALVLPS